MKPDKSKDLMVSATGTWRVIPEPGSPRREKTTLPLALGVHSPATVQTVLAAINRAANGNETSVLSLPGRDGARNEVLKVRPAREEGYAIVSVERIDAAPALPDVELLMELFSLTATEAQVAVSLLVTEELRDIAEARGTSIETVRMHVKRLLQKTGMPNQKKLTVLLTTLAMLSSSPGRPQV